jgi:trehalose 6-phosphate synthase
MAAHVSPSQSEAATKSLADQLATLVAGQTVIVASNRGPVEFYHTADGSLSSRRGSGGVVTALAALARDVPLKWVATTMSAGDREAFSDARSAARTVRLGRQPLQVRYVPILPDTYRRYYDEVSNEILWFLQHYMWNPIYWPDFDEEQINNWDEGYRPVNEAIANAIVEEAIAGGDDGSNTIVLLQDYHLYLAAALVRARLPRATIQQFIHIPWPANRYWQFLPDRLTHEIYEGLSGNDVLGFQTSSDRQNFLVGAQAFLTDSRVDFDRQTVVWRRRRLVARVYPVPADTYEIKRTLLSAPAREGAQELEELLRDDRRIIMRVDRLDPSKNILRGFLAYEAMLRRWPELRGQVTFLAFLIPSRQSLRIYRTYKNETRALIKRINAEFGSPGWEPIIAFFENNRPRALAAMRRYDVLLVNPIIDGMNLVAKEGPAANERDGVLVLSRTAGAFGQLAEAALPITATDIDETATELYEALRMSSRERAQRAKRARDIVEAETPVDWVFGQLRDAVSVRRAVSRRRGTASAPARTAPVA